MAPQVRSLFGSMGLDLPENPRPVATTTGAAVAAAAAVAAEPVDGVDPGKEGHDGGQVIGV
jgi:hypothetical protein